MDDLRGVLSELPGHFWHRVDVAQKGTIKHKQQQQKKKQRVVYVSGLYTFLSKDCPIDEIVKVFTYPKQDKHLSQHLSIPHWPARCCPLQRSSRCPRAHLRQGYIGYYSIEALDS